MKIEKKTYSSTTQETVSTHQSLARSAGVIGSFTFVSRVLGFGRDILIAKFFGTSIVAEAFVVSFKLPNLFRDLVGEGAMNAAIVPVLTETRALQGEREFWRLTWTLLFWFTLALTVISLFGVIFAPQVVSLVAPGFVKDPAKYHLTIDLTRLIFPFIFLIGFSAFLMGILHTLKKFGTSALGPSFLNLSMIGALVLAVPQWGVEALGWGILLGGLLQCVFQIVSLVRKGVGAMEVVWFHPGVRKILRLLGPRLFGTAVYQISVFVDMILASFFWIVGEGGQSALYYSSRLFQLPLAIFGVALAQAALPTLSGHAAKQKTQEFRHSIDFALRNVIFTSMPAAWGLAIFSEPIIRVLFKRGEFTDYSVLITSQALFFYAMGLVACGVIKVLVSAFYAMQDTKTPVRTAALCLLVNIGLNLWFMWPLKIGGLALATSLAATLNAVLLFGILWKRVDLRQCSKVLRSLIQSLVASGVMSLICITVFLPWIHQALDQKTGGTRGVFELLVSVVLSVGIYYVTSLALKSEEAENAKHFFKKAQPSNDS